MITQKTSVPFQAYKGKEPYIFISYAHADSAMVFPELIRIRSWGLNIWYDEGIAPGSEWPDEIASAIEGSSFFLLFVTPRSVASVNCRNEVYYALELNKPFLSVHLEDTNINAIHRGLKLSIGALQFIPKHMFDEDVYVRKLSEAVGKPLPIDVSQSYGDKKSDCAKLGLEKKAEDGSYEFRSDPGWLQAHSHRWPKAGQGWSNSLNLRFVPAGTDNILLSTYLVRVQDFTEFIECTQHPMTGGIFVVRAGLIWDYDQERNWKNPGYEQEPDHPVVGVSWNDAMAFCKWLTLKEKNAGLMGPHQYYRLPKDTEWSAAVGPAKYPWGDNWPPAEGTGKFAEQSFAESIGISNGPFFPWRDKYPRTSPVGTYRPNDYGLYDMAGNVMEWCDDWYTSSLNSSEILTKLPHLKLGEDGGGKKYKCIRSSSWNAFESEGMLSNLRYPELPSFRDDNNGFRLALSLSES